MRAPRGIFAASVSILVALAAVSANASPGFGVSPDPWPTSSALVLAEVITGGVSASDEYVELYNAGPVPVDAGGCELLYVSASGATVTRKVTLASPLSLEPGQHLLVANVLGMYGPLADATYTGGLAAGGGSLVLETPSGTVLDAVSWGSANNSFLEGLPVPAPPAGSSIERQPGGAEGNGRDTNDSRADWSVQANPLPQSLSSAPTGTTGPSASATFSATAPGASPSQTNAASPTGTSTATSGGTIAPTVPTAPTAQPSTTLNQPTPGPTQTGEASGPPGPTLIPSLDPTASAPASASPPVATTGPGSTTIALARAAVDGSHVTIEGVLTASLGSLESAHGGFVQDASGGIAVYLSVSMSTPLAAGTMVRVAGTIDDRYGQRTVRADSGDVVTLGAGTIPAPADRATGAVCEGDEGLLVATNGVVAAAPDSLADGIGLWLDDGSGPLRVVVTPNALGTIAPVRGMRLQVTGPIGQHTSASSAGYRLDATEPGRVVVDAGPSPAPSDPSARPSAPPTAGASARPSPSPTAGASVRPSPSPTAGPSVRPSPTDPEVDLVSIAAARSLLIGTHVRVAGAIAACPGVLGSDVLLAIADSSAGIFVRLAAPLDGLALGRSFEVVGELAAPYGQLEVRELDWTVLGDEGMPAPSARISLSAIGESTEGSLVRVSGTVDSVSVEAGRLTMTVGDGKSIVRVLADPATGLSRADAIRGAVVDLTGIVGQRSTGLGRLDGYRLWLRNRSDLSTETSTPPSASGSTPPSASGSTPPSASGSTPPSASGSTPPSASGSSPSPTPKATAPAPIHRDLASAISTRNAKVDVAATVTAQAGLLDVDGPTIVVDDGTAAVAVILPDDSVRPRVGSRVRVVGTVGTWHLGPKVVASQVELLGDVGTVPPVRTAAALGPANEWRLVQVCGRIDRLTRAGARWRAELLVDGRRVIVLGEPASGVPATRMVKGGLAIVAGIVRRSTSDNSVFQLLPRNSLDVRVSSPVPGGAADGVVRSQDAGRSNLANATGAATGAAIPHLKIGDLSGSIGLVVVVSGLVTETDGETAVLDDGTGSVILSGAAAAESLAILEPGDALEITGEVATGALGLTVIVDPERIVSLGGSPGLELGAAAVSSGGLGFGLGPAMIPGSAGRSDASSSGAPGSRGNNAIDGAAGFQLGQAGGLGVPTLWPALAIGGIVLVLLLMIGGSVLATRKRVRVESGAPPIHGGAEARPVQRCAAAALSRLRSVRRASRQGHLEMEPIPPPATSPAGPNGPEEG